MTEFIEVLKALPALIWSLVGACFLSVMWPQIQAGLGRVETFEGFGLKISLRALSDAVEARQVELSGADSPIAKDRLKRERERLAGAEILWVDDRPSGNRLEARIFQALGAQVTFAASNAEALEVLARTGFHLVISDIDRDGRPEGLELLNRLRANGVRVPFIFYVGHATQPPPDGAQGVADRPDALALQVLDALVMRAVKGGTPKAAWEDPV